MTHTPFFSSIELTSDQVNAFNALTNFLKSNTEQVFILNGYAGTGKTTLISGLIKYIVQFKDMPFFLMASTGRAAKMMEQRTGQEASTLHRHLFAMISTAKQNDKKEMELNLFFTVRVNDDPTTAVYIVDESSMISGREVSNNALRFGSSNLLKDYFDFANGRKIIFIGDNCQLPPPSSNISPALSKEYLESHFNIKCAGSELKEVMRQKEKSGIFNNARDIRNMITEKKFPLAGAIKAYPGYKDMRVFGTMTNFLDNHFNLIKQKGVHVATLICPSNSACFKLNTILRKKLYGSAAPLLVQGDALVITRNNHINGLMNGDQVFVTEVTNEIQFVAGIEFQRIWVVKVGEHTDRRFSTLIVRNLLQTSAPQLPPEAEKKLLQDFFIRLWKMNIKPGSPLFQDMMAKDQYLNALQATYGYAITCHKAQGGEWDHVSVLFDYSLNHMDKPSLFRWVYTAITRTTANFYCLDHDIVSHRPDLPV